MSGFALPAELVRRKANHEFFVANWPEGLQRASQRERELLGLMSHPCYRLLLRRGDDGLERLVVSPSPGQRSPVTEEARAFIQRHRSDLIAWCRERDRTRQQLEETDL